MKFSSLVDEIKNLSLAEKEELEHLLHSYLIEERRTEIYQSCQESKQEDKEGKLKFSSDINELKQFLSEE